MGWIGNVFLLAGVWLLGYRQRSAFLFTFAGELFWVVASFERAWWDSLAICALFAVLSARNWMKWGAP